MNHFWLLVVVFIVVLLSMVLHELAHGLVAYWLGDGTAKREGRLTLNPVKHLDPFLSVILPFFLFISGGPIFGGAKPVPINTRSLKHGVWGMALVGIAGPLTNFLVAFVMFLISHFTGLFGVNTFWGAVMTQSVLINLGFGIFNLIPIPPLDGSRVLYAIAPDGVREVMEKMEAYGIWIVMLLVIFAPSLVSNIMGAGINAMLNLFQLIV